MHTFVSNVIMKICINVIYFIKRCLLLKARIFTCFSFINDSQISSYHAILLLLSKSMLQGVHRLYSMYSLCSARSWLVNKHFGNWL